MRDSMAHQDVMPILSPGRHRSPRRGACFMEFASYLAGERWSDHPACTHGTLAHLARLVNDRTSDAGRARLAPLIPTVIGLTSDDPLLDVVLAVRAAQRRRAHRRRGAPALAGRGAARRPHGPRGTRRRARRGVARTRGSRPPRRPRRRRLGHPVHRGSRSAGRPAMTVRQCRDIVTGAVDGIARACVGDPDDRLVALLTAAVSDTARFVGASREGADVRAEADCARHRRDTGTGRFPGLRARVRLPSSAPCCDRDVPRRGPRIHGRLGRRIPVKHEYFSP